MGIKFICMHWLFLRIYLQIKIPLLASGRFEPKPNITLSYFRDIHILHPNKNKNKNIPWMTKNERYPMEWGNS